MSKQSANGTNGGIPSTGPGNPRQEFRSGDVVLVRLRVDGRFGDEPGELTDLLLAGTCLIGVWEEEQPREEDFCDVTVNGTTWTFDLLEVDIERLDGEMNPLKEQERIAKEHLALAKQFERQGKVQDACRAYARAIAELQACASSDAETAGERVLYATLLVKAERISEARAEMERAARAYEAKAVDPRLQRLGGHLDYAEAAVQVLVSLGTVIHLAADLKDAQTRRAFRQVVERLLAMNRLIKKRYKTKVELLFQAAEFLQALGETEEALSLFDQAETFYQKQLAYLDGLRSGEPITQLRTRVKAQLGSVERARTMKFRIVADTADELGLLLKSLQDAIPGLRVTKEVTRERQGSDARTGFRYTANVIWSTTLPSSQQASGNSAAHRESGDGRQRKE